MSISKKYKSIIDMTTQRRELKICVIGSVDAGKSSLVSVLVYKKLDDGRGKARKKIFKHMQKEGTTCICNV